MTNIGNITENNKIVLTEDNKMIFNTKKELINHLDNMNDNDKLQFLEDINNKDIVDKYNLKSYKKKIVDKLFTQDNKLCREDYYNLLNNDKLTEMEYMYLFILLNYECKNTEMIIRYNKENDKSNHSIYCNDNDKFVKLSLVVRETKIKHYEIYDSRFVEYFNNLELNENDIVFKNSVGNDIDRNSRVIGMTKSIGKKCIGKVINNTDIHNCCNNNVRKQRHKIVEEQ
jgi:hypothetical protein